MTDQSANDLFHASSFMQGHNAEYLEQLYARYANDPNAVDAAWQEFFRQMGDTDLDVKKEAAGPSWARTDWPPVPSDELTSALDGQWPAPPSAESKQVGVKIAAKAEEQGIEVTNGRTAFAAIWQQILTHWGCARKPPAPSWIQKHMALPTPILTGRFSSITFWGWKSLQCGRLSKFSNARIAAHSPCNTCIFQTLNNQAG